MFRVDSIRISFENFVPDLFNERDAGNDQIDHIDNRKKQGKSCKRPHKRDQEFSLLDLCGLVKQLYEANIGDHEPYLNLSNQHHDVMNKFPIDHEAVDCEANHLHSKYDHPDNDCAFSKICGEAKSCGKEDSDTDEVAEVKDGRVLLFEVESFDERQKVEF